PEQHRSSPIMPLREAEPAVFLRHFDSERANLRQPLEVLRRNFTGAIDLIGIDMFAKITFKLAQKLFPSGAILGALCRIRVNSIEVVSADEQVAGETAPVLKRISRRLGELKRSSLALGHFVSVAVRRRCK